MKRNMMILLIALTLLFGVAGTSALASEAKTLTVGASAEYTSIQDAIDFIAAQTDPTGWTINVQAGTYEDFVILMKMDGLSIIGSGEVVINVLDGTSGASAAGKKLLAYTADAVYVHSANVTLKNLYFNMGSVVPQWCSPAVAIGNGKNTMAMANGLVIDNCDFVSTSGTGYGVFMDNKFDTATIQNCLFQGMAQAIYMENSSSRPEGMVITNNTFTNCSFAFHGSYGHSVEGDMGSFSFTNNTLNGTDSLRCKFIFQDTDNRTNAVVTITGNTVNNAVLGLVNLQEDGEAVFENNTYGSNSYFVNAIEPGTIEVYATYSAPEGAWGRWVLNDESGLTGSSNPDGALEAVQAAIDKANAEHSNTLTITGIDESNLIRTFTWFKDMIYWETLPEPDPAVVTLRANKTLNGDVPVDGAFRFVLKDADGKPIQVKPNIGGRILFDALSFSDEGVYTYTIEEVAGDDRSIQYDESVYAITITVTLTDNTYTASAVVSRNGEAYQAVPSFANIRLQADVPKTGDHTPLFAAMLALTLSAILFVCVSRRKHA